MSTKSPDDGTELLELLGDTYVQDILAATSQGQKSARELSSELEADISTIYRRVDDMLEYELLVERTQIVDDGSHHSVYKANIDHVDIDIEDGEFIVGVKVHESPAERFTRIWDDIREI
ncbi:transcriptional regulator [Haloarculaceae archaeon H-GB2-1]|nr:transcriptional regulator [Haloarculaceae archaeon H-GB1-1]MEA5386805.1 transcriptional regulator [Haloarculaceae archaeon H-GB11]MEA5408280.1 transcriptional regulator [Haloarculaceae archaeon H-GB2-1]